MLKNTIREKNETRKQKLQQKYEGLQIKTQI